MIGCFGKSDDYKQPLLIFHMLSLFPLNYHSDLMTGQANPDVKIFKNAQPDPKIRRWSAEGGYSQGCFDRT